MADARIPSAPAATAPLAPVATPRAAPAASPKPDAKPEAKSGKSFWPSFHEVLSALNPLQYVPVVGTLYRSLTGDTIPETTRMAGSLVFSGLTSGPVGIVTSIAADFLERATGIDPERIGHNILASLGIGSRTPDPAAAAPKGGPEGDTMRLADAPKALTASQLAAYGIRRDGTDPAKGSAISADQLNAIELAQLRSAPGGNALAAASYAKTMA